MYRFERLSAGFARFAACAALAGLLGAGPVLAAGRPVNQMGSPRAAAPNPDPEQRVLRAAPVRGQILEDFEHGVPTELLEIDAGLAPSLLAAANDETVRVEDWPVAPDRRETVVLTRRDVYAPEARILRVERGRTVEVPRSRLVFLWGAAELDEETRVLVTIDPDTLALQGFTDGRGGKQELRVAAEQAPARPGRPFYRLAPPEAFAAPGEEPEQAWSCGAGEAPQAMPLSFASGSSTAVWDEAINTLHTATVAIDTDNELLQLKFSDNTTAAANYIAQLFAAMNVFYERDLLVRLVQGTTFLRVSSTPDPWTGGTGAADSAKLQQFSTYWNTKYGGVGRAVAALLSGKSASTGSSSGIAWINGLCSTSIGYSFTQVFRSPSSTGSADAFVVGHEIGHNFGSNHTHCYLTPTPIDACYNGQSGCYSGPTSCPAETNINGVPARGTLMSYCHLLGGCRADRVFHPRTADLLDPIIENRVGVCIFPAVSGPTIAAVTPASGSTAGGTPIVVTGTGFAAGATLSLGGVPATSVVVTSPTRITAVTGPRATGAVSAVVTNPDGGAATRANAFFYSPPPPATGFYTLTPCRVIDTRNPNGPLGGPALGPSAQRTFDVTGPCGIPNGAQALSVNVTVTGPSAPGSLTFYPGNAFPLGTSTINFWTGATRANNAILKLATDGSGTIGVQNAANGATHVIVDVNGYFL
jgi:hypothetical protein